MAAVAAVPDTYMDRPPFARIDDMTLAGEVSSPVGDLPPNDDVDMRLFISRIGKFTVGSVGDDSTQCGFAGARELNYRVFIEGDCMKLTPEGFIIDNFAVQRYFDAKYGGHVDKFLSCEKIAIQAVKDFRRMVPGCKCVTVTIDGTSGAAGLTASWRADGQDMPVAGAF